MTQSGTFLIHVDYGRIKDPARSKGCCQSSENGAPALASSYACGYLKSRYGGVVRMKLELIRHVHVSEEYFTDIGSIITAIKRQ